MIQLPLLARHFAGTLYSGPCTCAIAKAAKEHFCADYVGEGLDNIDVDDAQYGHAKYYFDMFLEDKAAAESTGYDDTVIRTIELIPK